MDVPSDTTSDPQRPFTCPVCRATQSPREHCRRCGADLALMLRAIDSGQAARRRLELALETADTPAAARLRGYLEWLEGRSRRGRP